MRRIIIAALYIFLFIGIAFSDGIEMLSLGIQNICRTLPSNMHQLSLSLAYVR
jgi:hypothetical protein